MILSDNITGHCRYKKPLTGTIQIQGVNCYDSVTFESNIATIAIAKGFVTGPNNYPNRPGVKKGKTPIQYRGGQHANSWIQGKVSRIKYQPSKITVVNSKNVRLKIDNILVVNEQLYIGNTIMCRSNHKK